MIVPGSTVGILGGGQVGRMMIVAGRSLGYKFHIFEPKGPCIAGMVADLEINANYNDEEALRSFAEGVDVITLEFENIPTEVISMLSSMIRYNISLNRIMSNIILNGSKIIYKKSL